MWSPPMDIATDEAFREIDRGPIGDGWTNLTPEEIEARDGVGAISRCANEQEYGAHRAVNGGEGFCDLRRRVLPRPATHVSSTVLEAGEVDPRQVYCQHTVEGAVTVAQPLFSSLDMFCVQTVSETLALPGDKE